MTLSQDQVLEVLQLAAAYDRRTVGQIDVAEWQQAAARGQWATRDLEAERVAEDGEKRWSNALALEAVRQHYASSGKWLMPGDITAIVTRIRQTLPPPPPVKALPRGASPSPAELAARAEIARLVGSSGRLPEDVRRVRRSKAELVREHAAAANKALADLERLIRDTTPKSDPATEGEAR
jgi:hypothetical protein